MRFLYFTMTILHAWLCIRKHLPVSVYTCPRVVVLGTLATVDLPCRSSRRVYDVYTRRTGNLKGAKRHLPRLQLLEERRDGRTTACTRNDSYAEKAVGVSLYV